MCGGKEEERVGEEKKRRKKRNRETMKKYEKERLCRSFALVLSDRAPLQVLRWLCCSALLCELLFLFLPSRLSSHLISALAVSIQPIQPIHLPLWSRSSTSLLLRQLCQEQVLHGLAASAHSPIPVSTEQRSCRSRVSPQGT